MTISPSQAERLAIATRDLYATTEADLTGLLAKRLSQGIDAPQWATIKLSEVSRLRRETEAVIAQLQAESGQAIAEAVETAYLKGSNAAIADLKALPSPGEIVRTFGTTNQQAIQRIVSEAVLNVESTHIAILRQTQDVYRSAVAEASQFTVLGTETRRDAAQRVLNQFADKGITGFVDKAGRHWKLDSYAEMAVRSATGRAAVNGHLDRLQANGRDLVIVSNSPEECHLCRPHEGKVYSISGASSEYPPLSEAREAGLFHPSCSHTTGLYVPGLTRPMTDTANPQGYEERQTQRYHETQIRHWKRREAAAMDAEERKYARSKVREWQAVNKQFVEEHDRKRLYYREQIGKAH